MSKKEKEKNQQENPQEATKQETPITDTPVKEPDVTPEGDEKADEVDELEQVKAQLESSQKEYLFLMQK